ncbi:diguanylate cyclase [Colwellia sp. Arc7-635]|uniref:diguanylate cyclase n=1 Tax=Colwellia sp. Arc7-635 TaxID=2497879 RepID=UPI000F854B26|nr:diguanylate cyclase [Colwellia sp. Arc7-635]AZQ85636.1 diguanylate cyclase [Colwellia sp. Arc7-635]
MLFPEKEHLDVTILIVDDDPSIIVTTSKALNGLGKIIFATNGSDALMLAETKLPDVILLDAEMPDMDGFEVCMNLKKKERTAHIPIIFITSHSGSDFEMKVFDAGASDYINKPLNPRVVLARASLQLNYKRALESLEHLSLTDSLTGLFNRRAFDKKFSLEFTRAQRSGIPITLLMLDIDEFKKYNDHFGHIMGDTCIQQTAGALLETIQRTTDFVARYGGEEFAIVLPDTNLEGAKYFANSILNTMLSLDISHAPTAKRNNVTLSIGYYSLIPTHKDSYESLLKVTDAALFKAKENGRACIYTPQVNT